MNRIIIGVFVIGVILRVLTLLFSIRNENILKKQGAIEYGKTNSVILLSLHTIFYLASLSEGILKKVQFDKITILGIFLYVFSMLGFF